MGVDVIGPVFAVKTYNAKYLGNQEKRDETISPGLLPEVRQNAAFVIQLFPGSEEISESGYPHAGKFFMCSRPRIVGSQDMDGVFRA